LTVAEAVREYLVDCRIRNLSDQTIAFYERRLPGFLEPWWHDDLADLTRQQIRERIGEYLGRYSPATVNGYIRGVKAVLNWALREDYGVGTDPRSLRKVKEARRVMPHLADPQDIARLLAQPDRKRFTGIRDHMMMMLMLDTGIRLGELIGLDLDDVKGNHIVLRGKGRKERIVAMSAPAEKAMLQYIRARSHTGFDGTALFVSRHGRRINKRTVADQLKHYAEAAGIHGISLSPHRLRYSFATHFLRNGGSIVSLQQVLGHTTLAMARHYAQMVDQDAFEETRAYSPVAVLGHSR
jgi:integrase/recombinase XerD